MPWILFEPTVFDHRKTVQLSLTLGLRETHLVGHLSRLWTWALASAPSGELRDLGALESSVIARAADWTGDLLDLADAEAFVGALFDVGFLDRLEDGGFRLHGWRERHEQWAERREREAEAASDPDSARKRQHAQAQAEYRARKRDGRGDRGVVARDVTRDGTGDQRVIVSDHGGRSRVTDGDVMRDQRVTDGDVTRDDVVIEGDITRDRGVMSRVITGDITRDAPDRTGPGPEITGPDPSGSAPPAPRTRGEAGRRESFSGGGFDRAAGAAALTGQWLRWPPSEGERPAWEAWARSNNREDLVNRPPPEALVASVSDAMERQRANGTRGAET